MGLFGRTSTTVGLDIGSGLIKLVAISHTSGGPVLTKVALTPIGNDAIVEGEIMDPGIVAEAIKGLMASAGVKGKNVVTALRPKSPIHIRWLRKRRDISRYRRQPMCHTNCSLVSLYAEAI
jgi:Tfp pilus assembly PilM family ATPase